MDHTNGTVMGTIKVAFALILISITVAGCLSVLAFKPANAQTIPKPSVPEFTVSYVDRSYDTPVVTRTTTDPYTGKQATQTYGGEHIENRTIDVTIKNQQFAPITLSNGSVVQLFYYIRFKGHYENWSPSTVNGYNIRVQASNSEATVATLVLESYGLNVPNDGSVDFQVEALGAIDNIYHFGITDYHIDLTPSNESGWSPIQTLNLADSSSSPNSTINATSLNPQLYWPGILAIILVPLLLSALSIALLLKHRRVKHE